MVRKSYGKMRGTRYKMQVRKKPTVNQYLQKFEAGDSVHVNLVSSSKFPHPRFQGLTGHVVEKRGDAYAVAVKDGNKPKMIFVKPEHLKKAG